MQAGSVNSMGVFIDDPQSIASLRDVFVDFYSGCTKSTIARGKEAVHSALFVTSNEVVNGTARYIGKHLETQFFLTLITLTGRLNTMKTIEYYTNTKIKAYHFKLQMKNQSTENINEAHVF